jgi:dihydroxyacetone kinase-like protein
LQRGLTALTTQSADLASLDWSMAWQKIGMTLMSTIGGASGSLYGTLFIAMSKTVLDKPLNLQSFAYIFAEGVEAVKKRGKAGAGEKTMLDVFIPVAEYLKTVTDSTDFSELLKNVSHTAIVGMESTRDMIATKGRASFLGERSKGHIDAGAKTGQLMICALVDVLADNLTTPS